MNEISVKPETRYCTLYYFLLSFTSPEKLKLPSKKLPILHSSRVHSRDGKTVPQGLAGCPVDTMSILNTIEAGLRRLFMFYYAQNMSKS